LNDEYILVPHSWRLALSLTRVALALSCLFVEAVLAEPSSLLIRFLLILFLLYSVVSASWRTLHRVRYAIFSLVLDSLFFLISVTIESPYSPWLDGVFYLFLISSALLVHPWTHVAVVSAVVPLLYALVRPAEFTRLFPVLALAGALGLVSARNRQLLIDRLIGASRKAVFYRAESQQARYEERERIAADFHDGPQQSFISLQMRLEVVRRQLERDPAKAMEELIQLQETTHEQVEEVRAFVRSMRPPEVESLTLTTSVSRLLDYFEKDSGIATTFYGDGQVEVDNRDLAREILQIVREALHNAQKHSGAARVIVDLQKPDAAIELSIKDDGSGFSFSGSYSLEELDAMQLGPKSIMRRVRGLDGELTVNSTPGHGAGVKVRVPL